MGDLFPGEEQERLRPHGIEHEIRLSDGRSVDSKNLQYLRGMRLASGGPWIQKKKSTVPKKEDQVGRQSQSLGKGSEEARKGSNGDDKVDPP